MALVEQGIYSLLSNTAGITALISTRIYPLRLPQNVTYPAMSYQRISSNKVHSMQGGSGLDMARFQFSVWGPDYLACKAVIEALRNAVQGYIGTNGSVDFRGWLHLAERDALDDPGAADSSETAIVGIQVDYQVNYWEEPTRKVT